MLEYFAMKNQFHNLGLKELSLYFFDLLNTLPFIPNLHSLHLVLLETLTKIPNEYGNLKKLRLDSCPELSDISAFGKISDIHISNCPMISDISQLNHNKRVTIENCVLIEDCRESFRYTRYLKIQSEQSAQMLFDFSRYKHLRRFECFNVVAKEGDLPMRPFNPKSVQRLPERLLASSLQELTLTKRSIASIDISLLGSVPRLRLENIENLKSLEGLGRGNKSVYIRDCWGYSRLVGTI